MKKHISILAFLMSLLISVPSSGQLVGYGNGTYGNKSVASNDGIFYTDDTRAHVVSISGNTVEIEGLAHNFSGTALYNNALIIQMVGGTQGKHQGVTISGTASSGSNTILTLSASLSGYSTSGGDRVQIILVPQYYDFTVNSGMVTCHPWDGKTGGILCMMVQHDLTVRGGYLTVAGKGFYPEGVSWGTPGTGGASSSVPGIGGVASPGGDATGAPGYSPCNTPCISGADVSLVLPGYSGGNGSAAGGVINQGTSNTGTGVIYNASNLNTSVIMGNAGYYSSGTGAGDGGEGGGAGGGGGASISNPGNDGNSGQPGGFGGEPGEGARGGGIIYIKAGSFYNNTGNPVFFGNGGRGENGRPGENGGHGGEGGRGGLGECSGGSAHFSGGTGGSGFPGNGSEGGDAADGGHPGYLWLIYNSGPGANIIDVDISGGDAGEGGDGGLSYSKICLNSAQMVMNSCSLGLTQCSSSGGGGGGCAAQHSCDCDRAYKLLRKATSSALYSPGVYAFYNGFSQIVAFYDLNAGELIGFEMNGCREFYSHCPVFSKSVCNEIFTNIINFQTFVGAYTMPANVFNKGVIEFGVAKTNTPSSSSEYFLEYNSNNKYLIDYTNPKGNMKCYNGACLSESYYGSTYHINQGNKGTNGQNGYTGHSSGNSANFPTSGNISGWKNGPSGVNQAVDQIGIVLYPSPAEAELKFSLSTESSESMEVSIYDLGGSLVETLHFKTEPGENQFTINVESLATGVYYFKAVMGAKGSALTFVKQ